MGRIDKLLAEMRANPRGWRIEDLETIAARLDISVRKHAGGSHVIFYRAKENMQVSVPAHKPLKQVYVRQFLELAGKIKE